MGNYLEVKSMLLKEAAKSGVPLLGEFELTSRCNLKCEMCYVREDYQTKELSTDEWKTLFLASYNSGMLFALLTGGEIFLRKDFIELYTFLYQLGVRITLYTNGTLLNEEMIDVLKRYPPERIGITLYGASNSTYEIVTKMKNGFDLVNRGIDLLMGNKINFFLRTIPIKSINHDVDDLIAYAKSKNHTLGYTLYIGPRRETCDLKLQFRLSPEELMVFEQKIVTAFGYQSKNQSNHSSCLALKSAFFINWEGKMQPCALLNYPSQKIMSNTFDETWKTLVKQMRETNTCGDCDSCSLRNECLRCHARLYLEGGFNKCSDYLKNIAKIRDEVKNGYL